LFFSFPYARKPARERHSPSALSGFRS
jgi:hypothetical protein